MITGASAGGGELVLVIPNDVSSEVRARLREVGRCLAVATADFLTSDAAQKIAAHLARAAREVDRFAVRGEPKRPAIAPVCGPTTAAGRNDLCPCGSALKFKKCCRAKPNHRASK